MSSRKALAERSLRLREELSDFYYRNGPDVLDDLESEEPESKEPEEESLRPELEGADESFDGSESGALEEREASEGRRDFDSHSELFVYFVWGHDGDLHAVQFGLADGAWVWREWDHLPNWIVSQQRSPAESSFMFPGTYYVVGVGTTCGPSDAPSCFVAYSYEQNHFVPMPLRPEHTPSGADFLAALLNEDARMPIELALTVGAFQVFLSDDDAKPDLEDEVVEGVDSDADDSNDDDDGEPAWISDAFRSSENQQQDFARVASASAREGSTLLEALRVTGLRIVDNRKIGGALWVIGDERLAPLLTRLYADGARFRYLEHGGRTSRGAPAWYLEDR